MFEEFDEIINKKLSLIFFVALHKDMSEYPNVVGSGILITTNIIIKGFRHTVEP